MKYTTYNILYVTLNWIENLIKDYNIPMNYKIQRIKHTYKDSKYYCIPNLEIQWYKIKKDFQDEIYKASTVKDCAIHLLELFSLNNLQVKKLPSGEQKNKKIEWIKREIISVFFMYKEYSEKYNVSLIDFVNYLYNNIYAQYSYLEFCAPLIGLRSKLKVFKIGNFVIRKLRTKEKLVLLDSIENSKGRYYSSPDEIISGPKPRIDTQYWFFLKKSKLITKPFDSLTSMFIKSYSFRSNDIIDEEIQTFLTALRLYKYSNIGITSVFIREAKGLTYIRYSSFQEKLFLSGEFGKYFKGPNLKIETTNVLEINQLTERLNNLEDVEQIRRSIYFYFRSFQHNLPIYRFTDLIVSFESLFNDGSKVRQNYFKNLIIALKGKSPSPYSIQPAVNRLKVLLEKTRKGKKKIQKIMFDSNKPSAYFLRNKLLHGALELESKEVEEYIDKIVLYLSQAIKKILILLEEKTIDCNSDNYFYKLDAYLYPKKSLKHTTCYKFKRAERTNMK